MYLIDIYNKALGTLLHVNTPHTMLFTRPVLDASANMAMIEADDPRDCQRSHLSERLTWG